MSPLPREISGVLANKSRIEPVKKDSSETLLKFQKQTEVNSKKAGSKAGLFYYAGNLAVAFLNGRGKLLQEFHEGG